VAAAVLGALAWAWWPDEDSYRPIRPGERGLLTTLLQEPTSAGTGRQAAAIPFAAAAHDRLTGNEPLVATFQEGRELPTEDDPALALVLVPSEGVETDGSGSEAADIWVFPFDQPLPPAEGDNQALAVATTDGTVSYDVAFALVWAEGDEVLNVNEAHAYASCSDCVAVAVAFQVVLIMDDANVVVPQNLAVAANYDCYRCITAAVASQLVLSVHGEPGQEDLRLLAAVWDRLIQFAQTITSYTLTQVAASLEAFKAEIVGILEEAPAVEPQPNLPTTPTPTPTGNGSDLPSPPPTTADSAPSVTNGTEASSPPAPSSPSAPEQSPESSPSSAPSSTSSPVASSSADTSP
jgi:putative peptide zinc metalloprotease protein